MQGLKPPSFLDTKNNPVPAVKPNHQAGSVLHNTVQVPPAPHCLKLPLPVDGPPEPPNGLLSWTLWSPWGLSCYCTSKHHAQGMNCLPKVFLVCWIHRVAEMFCYNSVLSESKNTTQKGTVINQTIKWQNNSLCNYRQWKPILLTAEKLMNEWMNECLAPEHAGPSFPAPKGTFRQLKRAQSDLKCLLISSSIQNTCQNTKTQNTPLLSTKTDIKDKTEHSRQQPWERHPSCDF